MSAFYEELARDANELIVEFGRVIVINRYTDTYNPVTRVNVRSLVATQNAKVAIIPASPDSIKAFDVHFMNDVLDQQNIRLALMSVVDSPFMPAPLDQATFDSKTWNVLGCTPLNVDGTPVIYTVGFMEA